MLDFIKNNSFIIRHALGQTIFNRRVEMEASVEVFTRDPSVAMDEVEILEPSSVEDPVVKELPSVEDPVMKNALQDPVMSQTIEENPPRVGGAFGYSSQELHDMLGPSEQPQGAAGNNDEEPLDYGLLEEPDLEF